MRRIQDDEGTKFLASRNLSVTYIRLTSRRETVGNTDNIYEIISPRNRVHITVVYIYWDKL
jgi:hypothetical protein